MTAIRLRFGLPAREAEDLTSLIKRADRIAAYLEATQLAGFSSTEASRLFGHSKRFDDFVLAPWPSAKAKRLFLQRCSSHATRMQSQKDSAPERPQGKWPTTDLNALSGCGFWSPRRKRTTQSGDGNRKEA